MANPNDVAMVRQGASLPRADLSSAKLFRADLRGADLGLANLKRADLRDANLSGADLRRALLIGTNLENADLSGAKLGWADLSKAKLSGSNLSQADLIGTNLADTELSAVNLEQVRYNKRTRWPAGYEPAPSAAADLPTEMLKQARSQARWLVGWGVINLLFASLSNPFGLILILGGLASYYLASASTFLVIGIVFLWAAVVNLFVGGFVSYFFSVVLAISTWVLVRHYLRFRPVEASLRLAPPTETVNGDALKSISRAERLLPLAAAGLAAVSLVGAVLAFFGATISIITASNGAASLSIFGFALIFALQLGVLALAAGAAGLLSNYRYKALSLLGAGGGAVAVLIYFGLLLLG